MLIAVPSTPMRGACIVCGDGVGTMRKSAKQEKQIADPKGKILVRIQKFVPGSTKAEPFGCPVFDLHQSPGFSARIVPDSGRSEI